MAVLQTKKQNQTQFLTAQPNLPNPVGYTDQAASTLGNKYGSHFGISYVPGTEPTTVPGSEVVGMQTADSFNANNPNYAADQKAKADAAAAAAKNDTALNLFQHFREQLQQPVDNISAGVESYIQGMKPKDLQPLGQDYWNTQRATAVENLNKEFFGPLGLAQKGVAQEGAAGRLGSGVSKRILQETVTDPFAQRAAGIESDVYGKQAENIFQTEAANKAATDQWTQFGADLIYKVRSGDQAARADAMKRLDDLTMSILSGQTHMNDQDAQTMINLIDAELKQKQLDMEFINRAGNIADPSMYTQAYWDSLSDDQIKAMFKTDSTHQDFYRDILKKRGVNV